MRTAWIGSGGCVGLAWIEWRDDQVGSMRRGMLVWRCGGGMGVWGYGGIGVVWHVGVWIWWYGWLAYEMGLYYACARSAS